MRAQAFSGEAAALADSMLSCDGTVRHQCVIRANDAPRLQVFQRRLSRLSILIRFLGMMLKLSSDFAKRLSHVDYENRVAVTPRWEPSQMS